MGKPRGPGSVGCSSGDSELIVGRLPSLHLLRPLLAELAAEWLPRPGLARSALDIETWLAQKLARPGLGATPTELWGAARGDRWIGVGVLAGPYLRGIGVARAARGRGVGSALLTKLEQRRQVLGADEVVLLAEPGNYLWPGLPAHCDGRGWARRGYAVRGTIRSLVLTLAAGSRPDGRVRGVAIRRAAAAEGAEVSAWLAREFSPAWAAEVGVALQRDPTPVFVAHAGQRLIGASAHSANWGPLGGFGPLAVSAPWRGRGVGMALLAAALQDLANRGAQTVLVPWIDRAAIYRRAAPIVEELSSAVWAKKLGP